MAKPSSPEDPFGSTLVSTSHNDTYPYIDPIKGNMTGAKVLVTGASKGIGRATVKSYARAGASSIALLARSNLDTVADEVAQAAKEAGRPAPQILKLQADMADAAAVQTAIDIVKREFRTLDVVVNNASRLERFKPWAETHVDDWWKTWELNIKGTYLVNRATLPLLLAGDLKTLLTISSAGAMIASSVHMSPHRRFTHKGSRN